MKSPQPQFRPAFQVGDKVRVKTGVDDFGGMAGIVTETVPGDDYHVRLDGVLFSRYFSRKELERA